MRPRVYLFLDVDGVLHSATPGVPVITGAKSRTLSAEECEVPAALRGLFTAEDPPFSCLPVFAAAVRPYLDQLEIVITSSWRTEPELYDAILAAMSPDVRARIAGATPRSDGRPNEINRWLHEHAARDARAIVLDDDDDNYAWHHLTRRAILLLTAPELGFTEEDGRCLAQLLSIDRPTFDALRAALPVVCRAEALMKGLESIE